MKRFICAAVSILLVALPVWAQDRITVFRDLAWGDPVEALGPVTMTEDRGRYKQYARTNEDLQLGPVKALVIRYGFFDGKLFQVMVGARDDQPLDELLVARYGKPFYDLLFEKAWLVPEQDTTVAYLEKNRVKVMMLFSESINRDYSKWAEAEKASEAKSAW